jgi:aminobenzoyl-glutamate transport protein
MIVDPRPCASAQGCGARQLAFTRSAWRGERAMPDNEAGHAPTGGDTMAEQPAGAGALDRFLTAIEVLGNAVPHPAIIFFMLIGIVIVLSVIFGLLGTTVTYEGYDPEVGDIVEQTTSVRSLLAPDGIRFMLTSPVANFLGFTGVGVILVAMIGVGLAEESGLIATLVRKLVAAAPRRSSPS